VTRSWTPFATSDARDTIQRVKASKGRARLGLAAFAVAMIGAAAACSTQNGTGGKGAGGNNNCSEQPCSLVPQCGCGASEECTIDAMGAHFCAMVGIGTPGQDCSTHGCVAGSACIATKTATGSASLCAAFCKQDSDCPGSTCSRHVSDGKGGVLPVMLCADTCDPAANTGCTSPGTACLIGQESTGAMRSYAQCAIPNGTATLGAACSPSAPCAPGLICGQSPAGTSSCFQYCTMDGKDGCPMGTKCVGFATPLVIGAVTFGACQ